jgi:cell division septation protein DedD
MRNEFMVAMLGIAVVGCAGRDPQPIATVQMQDQYADCTMIRAEIEANNAKVTQLANEQGWKVAQNVGAGVVGLVIWPVWFGMDFKDAAGKDAAALEARQKYLTVLATQRCAQPAPPAAGTKRAPRGQSARASAPKAAPPPHPPPLATPQAAAPEPEPEVAPYQDAPH